MNAGIDWLPELSNSELLALRICFAVFWTMCIIAIIQFYWIIWRSWFKRGYITGFFYEWKGTNKAYIWYFIWMSILTLTNIIVLVVFAGYLWDMNRTAVILFFPVWCGSNFILASIYLIIKHQLRAYYDRKEEREEAEEERKRAEEREARRKAQTEEKPHNDSSAPPDSPDEHDAVGPNGEEK